MTKLVVIDYGMGNLHSVGKALEHIDKRVEVSITADPLKIHEADRLIFPGVGAIRDCMSEIRCLKIDALLREARREKPILGICVGMQAMMDFSEENNGVDCIGFFPGKVKRFPEGQRDANGDLLKVPHMGWNQVKQGIAHPMWHKIPDKSHFYFVHSYYVTPDTDQENSAVVAGLSEYPQAFCSALAGDNIFAVQFHPEKSQDCGLQLLKNFLTWDGKA
jgi:glutamine amidotransferase